MISFLAVWPSNSKILEIQPITFRMDVLFPDHVCLLHTFWAFHCQLTQPRHSEKRTCQCDVKDVNMGPRFYSKIKIRLNAF